MGLVGLYQNWAAPSQQSRRLGFSEFQGESVGVAPDAGSADFLREIVFRMVMERAVIFEFKAEPGQFLYDKHRIEAAPYGAIIRLHMTTGVINNPIDSTGFQRLKNSPV